MNTIAWIVLSVVVLVIVFDVGFVAGCIWASRNNKCSMMSDYQLETPTHHPLFASVCKRCGRVFDCAETGDPDIEVCAECWNDLNGNPEDEYFKREMFE